MKTILKLICAVLLFSSVVYGEKKVVLISGASGGIGSAAVKAFHEKGWKVWAGYRTHIPEELKNLEDINFIPLDVTDERMIHNAIVSILNADGRVDVLINNAGYGIIGPEECTSIEEAQQIFDVNFFGALRLIQSVTPLMRQQGGGHIINVSSTSGVRAMGGLGMYAASKFALEGLSEAMAVSLSPWNIHVSIVEPGGVSNQWAENCLVNRFKCMDPLYVKLTQTLRKTFIKFAPQGQACDEIAALFVSIAETPNPDMRYQTSAKVRELVAKKFVDPTGNAMRDEQLRFFNSIISE